MEDPRFVGSYVPSLTERMDPGAPECLVGVDVPEARDRSLVEQHGLDRSAACCEARGEIPRAEARRQRLGPESLGEIRADLGCLEEQPRSEPTHVAISDIRAVV